MLLCLVAVDPAAKKTERAAADLVEAEVWVKAHKAEIPLCVYNAIVLISMLRGELAKAHQRAANLLGLLRRELGITPKSERGKNSKKPSEPSQTKPDDPPKAKPTDDERLAALKVRRAKLLKEIRNYEDRLGKGRKGRHKPTASMAPTPGVADPPPEACKPVAEATPPKFAQSEGTLFGGNLAVHGEDVCPQRVNRVTEFENPRGLHSVSDARRRHEFGVTTKTFNLSVETVTDPRTGKSVTASTDHIGPPNSQSTWKGIANTVISVIGYAIPINRLAAMLKEANPYFTSGRLCAHLKVAADICASIYTCLGEQLADGDVLLGDDTQGRVLEVNRALKDGGELGSAPTGSLVAKIGATLGRVFDKKRGEGKKRQLNVSVVIGKSIADDPLSYIFFFRAHLGSLGDLLSKLLETRSPKKKTLTLVSDLATTNLLTATLYKTFRIIHAGCAAHARRPFWRHKDQDQKLCYWMLSAFLVLEQIEDRIDELGRTEERIKRYRHRYSRMVWAAIFKRCQSVMAGETIYSAYWDKASKLYKACGYIVKHYPTLTAYLDDPRLPTNNNLSERVLRWEKIMEDASKFRATEAGRLQVDILRTIVHTCSAAQVDLQAYLVFVFQNRIAVAADPTKFTPYAYALQSKARANLGVSEIV